MTLNDRLTGAQPLLLAGLFISGALALTTWGRERSLPCSATEQPACAEARCLEELERDSKAVIARLARKQRVTDEVIAGRLGLLEAAALFRALNQGPPRFHWQMFRLG